MVRALMLLQVASAAKSAMDVMSYAVFASDDCSGTPTGFSHQPLAANEGAATCEEDGDARVKKFCLNGQMAEQKYSDATCATKNGDVEPIPNGICYPGQPNAFAGCGNHQCESKVVGGAPTIECDHTPAKSVYRPPPAPMDVVVMDTYNSTDCSGTATRMYHGPWAAKKVADGDCTDVSGKKQKHWCDNGVVMMQEYSDDACATTKGDPKVFTDDCVVGEMGTSKSRKHPGCGNFKCSMNTGTLVCEYVPPTTTKNTSGVSGAPESQRGLAVAAVLAMAGALAA
jgi:hypothetical protein